MNIFALFSVDTELPVENGELEYIYIYVEVGRSVGLDYF